MDSGKIVAQAIEYVQTHLGNDRLTAQDVARETGYSADHLGRLFMARTGYTVTAYIVYCRLSRSAELLRYTETSVLEIALEVGFASHEGFIKAFKKQYHVTPSLYRRLHRETHEYASHRKGERSRMSNHLQVSFINDQEVIGKWERVAVLEPHQVFELSAETDGTDLGFDEIYFLPQGQGYWIFEGWTKGNLLVHYGGDEPVRCFAYRTKELNGQTYLFLNFEEEGIPYVEVLKKVSDKHYTQWEIGRHDDTNIPFVPDEKVVGKWRSVDCVWTPKEFEGEKDGKTLWLRSVEFAADGSAVRNYDGEEWQERWSNGVLIDERHATVPHYFFEVRNGVEYLFLEWKSGDYVYGGMKPAYYVFVRE